MRLINLSMHVFVVFGCSFLLNISVMQGQNLDSLYQDSSWIADQEYLNGRYIPADEQEAFEELERKGDKEGLEMFKNAPEDSIRGRLHYGLGGWMAENWRLHTGSRLVYHLNRKGLTFPDDMIEYLIISFHRHINNKALNSDTLISEFKKKRHQAYLERIRQGEAQDTLIYNPKTKELRKKHPDKKDKD